MIPNLEPITSRPVQLTAPEFTSRRRLDVSYEDIERMMTQQEQCVGGSIKSDPRSAFISLKYLALSQSGADRVTFRSVRIVTCAICTECGGFVEIFGESHISLGTAERQYWHIQCYVDRNDRYARLEDEGE